MFIEKKRLGVSPKAFTFDGSQHGLVHVADARGFFVKQQIEIKSTTQPTVRLEIKRFVTLTSFYVGPKGKIDDRQDISVYTVADSATIEAHLQDRPGITIDHHERAVYVEEPVVAKRVIGVDESGQYYNTQNPLPVRLSDGSINIGTVNAELEVQLSHIADLPDVGDVPDSVQVGDGVEIIQVNPDGSINVVQTQEGILHSILNIPIAAANTDTPLVLPATIRRFEMRVRDGKGVLKIFDTSGGPFLTIARGSAYTSGLIKNPALTFIVQSSQPGCVLEVECWSV